MEKRVKRYNAIIAVAIFIALPMLIYTLGDFPRRSLLKESISIATILAFFMMLMQFYLSRANNNVLRGHKMGKIVKWHKVLGYLFTGILILHPALVILPRFFEAGIDPQDAFITLITTSGSGVILGIIAWSLMLLLGITSIFRNKFGIKYKTWRVFHGLLSVLFISIATVHVVTTGRHMSPAMVWLIVILGSMAVVLLSRLYIFNRKGVQHDK